MCVTTNLYDCMNDERCCVYAGQEDPDSKGGPGGWQGSILWPHKRRYVEVQCLDVAEDGRIRHAMCHGEPHQRWYVAASEIDSESGDVQLRSKDSAWEGKCLYADNSGWLAMEDCTEAPEHMHGKWYVPALSQAMGIE